MLSESLRTLGLPRGMVALCKQGLVVCQFSLQGSCSPACFYFSPNSHSLRDAGCVQPQVPADRVSYSKVMCMWN